jgi:hypothetical protein
MLQKHFYVVTLFIMGSMYFCTDIIQSDMLGFLGALSQIPMRTDIYIINKHVYFISMLGVFVYSSCTSFVR